MHNVMSIPVSANALTTAADLARQCPTTVVRERVLISQGVALTVREHLRRTTGLHTRAGRSASLQYVDLLDVCDFTANHWRVEVRTITHTDQLALYVPTVPLIVRVLARIYAGTAYVTLQ